MKNLLDIYESLFTENTGFSGIFYHGSPKQFNKFSNEFVGGKDANDKEGPGIYFTSSIEEASHYGEFIYKVKINATNFLDAQTPSSNVDVNELYKLITMSSDWEMNAQDWAEDPEHGAKVASDSAIKYNDNEKDVFLQVWIDFYRYNSVDFVKNMIKLGYDGILINRDGAEGKHAIVYNLNVVEFINMIDYDVVESVNEYISPRDLDKIEGELDNQFKPLHIDIEFSRHFYDRLNDPRNGKEIEPQELLNTFKRLHYKHGKGLVNYRNLDALVTDFNNNLNIPFNLSYDKKTKMFELISKTIMRTNKFHSSDRKFKV